MTKKHPVLDDIATLTFDMGRCLRQKMLNELVHDGLEKLLI